MIQDDMAAEIVSKLDYDFSNADKDKAMSYGDVYKRQVGGILIVLVGAFCITKRMHQKRSFTVAC